MKRSFFRQLLLLITLLPALDAVAQSGPYGNEWIDYSKTYYKFKVGKTGVCRIYRSALNNAGLPSSVMGSNFMLYRDGKELPIHVSAETMSTSDYIEFWGTKADGMLDKELYLQPHHQPDDRISLFTDTTCYYLTYDAATSHKRFTAMGSNIPASTPSPAPYILATVGLYSHATWMPGPSYAGHLTPDPIDLWSPSFDNGEGFIEGAYGITQTISTTLQTPNLVSGYDGEVHAGIVARSYKNFHKAKLLFNGNAFSDVDFGIADAQQYNTTVPASMLNATSNQIAFSATPQGSSGNYDVYGISFAELEYPRNLDLAGLDQGSFQLPASATNQYLEFSNMGAGRLYDVTNQKWYDGNTTVTGVTRFYLDPSVAKRHIVILKDAATSLASLSPVKSFQFKNWSLPASQGDFVIVSHTKLMAPVGGRNYIQEYSDYRSSAAGGSRKVVIADVTELYDQFAYGYDIHPMSIKHFLKHAYDTWNTKPKDIFLIGRGIYYYQAALYNAGTNTYQYPIVPVYGVPGSDLNFVTYGTDFSPKMRIGRLSVWNAQEVGTYLNKVQNAEQLLAPSTSPTVATEIWKKRALHVIGSSSVSTQKLIEPEMAKGAVILTNPFTGMSVTTAAKSTNAAITLVNSAKVDSLLRNGTSLITFYGHASPYNFDYTLPDPASYNNNWRMPSLLALGCDAAQMFEVTTLKTLAERYTLAPTGGSTTFIASSNTSFTDLDNHYLFAYYRSVASTNYGGPVGSHVRFAHDSVNNEYLIGQSMPNIWSAQLECMILVGDPSIAMPSFPKPDYHVTDQDISSLPAYVTTSLDTFQLKIATYNLGKAMPDSVKVKIEHINPAGATSLATTYLITNLHHSDTSLIKIPIDKVNDLGLNKYRVTIDYANDYEEVSELNNTGIFEIFISSDNLVPVYPQEFAIVHEQGITLKASTLNVFKPMGRYRIELDTTELFNSPIKESTTINSKGGVIKWKPSMQYQDSVVYYWRTAYDSTVSGNLTWANSSFLYLQNGSEGWNQSHYYQYTKDASAGLFLHPDRVFKYGSIVNRFWIKNMVLCAGGPTTCNADGAHMQSWINDSRVEQSSYSSVWNGLHIMVIDSATGRVWMKTPTTLFGANPTGAIYSRQFDVSTATSRIAAARFLDTIPNGSYVIIKSIFWHINSRFDLFIDKWKEDTTITGPNKSLYHTIYNMGFTKIDSFYRERAFIFMRRKADPTLAVYQEVTDSLTQFLEPVFLIKGSDVVGSYISSVIGPAKAWNSFKWKTNSMDTMGRYDTTSVAIIGIDRYGVETPLFNKVVGDTSLESISANQYPKLRLLWKSKDSVTLSSPQLAYWRVLYSPVPEAALNPAIHYSFSDSLSQGQMQTFSTAVENLTPQDMDSMLVRYRVIGADGITRPLADKRYRPLPGNDTLHASITFDPAQYPGKNYLFVEANPADDQPEQYHPNNLGYLPFRIGVDSHNPLLDVTFDGVHILNGDIVSAKPFIKVKLKDENRFLALDDTSVLKAALRYPSDSNSATSHVIPFDGIRCRFIPATKTEPVNEAYIELKPELVEDGTYQLTVTGTDKSGNSAGATAGSGQSEYKISFEVDNKPSITRVLNYPNPFSTSTAFLFTLTGSQIPSQLKIQVLSVTGKVVREITRNELGPLHIGRNITEYKWDGRDQYGQMLGNGVYLYRVVTSLNGKDLDLRADTREMSRNGGGIDKYFKEGYGKMYIMR
jgi:hypothetical protein